MCLLVPGNTCICRNPTSNLTVDNFTFTRSWNKCDYEFEGSLSVPDSSNVGSSLPLSVANVGGAKALLPANSKSPHGWYTHMTTLIQVSRLLTKDSHYCLFGVTLVATNSRSYGILITQVCMCAHTHTHTHMHMHAHTQTTLIRSLAWTLLFSRDRQDTILSSLLSPSKTTVL